MTARHFTALIFPILLSYSFDILVSISIYRLINAFYALIQRKHGILIIEGKGYGRDELMTITQLEYFLVAANLQHYNQAAEVLNISESSLSRSIRVLENELGVTLFDRVGRNVELTHAGKILQSHAERILNEISVTSRKLHELATDGAHIDIAYVAPLARNFIPKTIRSFLKEKENRNVVFNFYQDITERNIDGLKNGKYDLIFGSYKENENTIKFIPILQQEMVVIMSDRHALAAKTDLSLDIFNQYPVLCYDQTSGLGRFSTRFFREHNLKPDIICSSPDEEGIASLAAEGFGVALVADVETIHRPGISIHRLSPENRVMHTVYMCYLSGRYQLPAVRRLIDYVRAENPMESIERSD